MIDIVAIEFERAMPDIKLITDPEERHFDPDHPRIKDHAKVTPVYTMITPGRRALGEDWSKVTIGHTDDQMTLEVEPTEAPASNRPIVVAHEGEMEMIDYILTAAREKAAQQAGLPELMTKEEKFKLVNEAWQDYIGNKLRWMQGVSTIGAGGLVQRERTQFRSIQ